MDDRGSRIPEDQARRLWERAAELQAEAARRTDEEAKAERAPEGGPEDAPLEEDEGAGYSLTHVRQAALEVGIDSDFLDLAMGEEAILELEGGSDEWALDRMGRRILADDRPALEFRRSFSSPSRQVWLALEKVFTHEPHELELIDIRGGEPDQGGVAIFESPYAFKVSESLRYRSAVADIRRYLVRVVPREGGGCELLIRAPLRRSRRLNGAVAAAFSGVGGVLGGLAGLGVAGLIVGSGGMATLPLAALMGSLTAGGAVGGGGLTRSGYIALYRWGLRSLERYIQKILRRVERDLERERDLRLPSET